MRNARQMQRLGEYGSRADEEDGRKQHPGRCETHGNDDSIGFETDCLQYRIAIQADAKHPGADIASNRQGFKAVAAKKQTSACKPRSCWPSQARSRSLAEANSGGTPALVTYNQSFKQWLAGQGTHSRVFWHLRPDNPVNRHEARRLRVSASYRRPATKTREGQ